MRRLTGTPNARGSRNSVTQHRWFKTCCASRSGRNDGNQVCWLDRTPHRWCRRTALSSRFRLLPTCWPSHQATGALGSHKGGPGSRPGARDASYECDTDITRIAFFGGSQTVVFHLTRLFFEGQFTDPLVSTKFRQRKGETERGVSYGGA